LTPREVLYYSAVYRVIQAHRGQGALEIGILLRLGRYTAGDSRLRAVPPSVKSSPGS